MLVGLLAVGFFIAGLLTCTLVSPFSSLHFAETIDAGNVLNAVATLFAAGATLTFALIINYLYTIQDTARRADSSLLLQLLDETKGALVALQAAALPCHRHRKLTPEEQGDLTRTERELSNSVNSFEKALSHCKLKAKQLDVRMLKDARSALKDSLTDSPYPGPYSATNLSRIVARFKSVRDELTRISFAVIHR